MRIGSFMWCFCVTLMIASMVLMFLDPWFQSGRADFKIGVVSLVVAFLTLSTLFYDARYFGKPRGGNLWLQILLFLPFTLFCQRLFGLPHVQDLEYRQTVLRQMLDLGRRAFDVVVGVDLVPAMLRELLSKPSLAVTLLILVSGTGIPQNRQIKVGWVLCAFLYPGFLVIHQQPSVMWVFGVVTMFTALGLMLHDVDAHAGDYHLVKRLKHVADKLEYQASVRICKEALTHGEISPDGILEIVRRLYVDTGGLSHEEIAHTLCMRLVSEHRLLVYILGADKVFEPSRSYQQSYSEFGRIILFPRNFLIFAIAIVWWISPLDLFPDALPVIGIVDDMLILWMGTTPMARYLKTFSRTRSRLNPETPS